MKLPRILIAAPASGTGKTMITCGLLQAMAHRGLNPCGFKCGPDFIDPMFHRQVMGIPSYNLDTFLAGEEMVRHLLQTHGKDAGVTVLEGVMGYYDGIGGVTDRASTYEVARVTKTPVILVINCKGQSLSAAAQVTGFMRFRKDSNIRGVILNRMNQRMFEMLQKAIEDECGIPVLGYVPAMEDMVWESRHLGLVMPEEMAGLRTQLDRLADTLAQTIDLEALLDIAKSAEELEEPPQTGGAWKFATDVTTPDGQTGKLSGGFCETGAPVKVALARDEAFCFIYEDNLELLKAMGAEILEFSPLHDTALLEADGLLLYGGYPELYGAQIEANEPMRMAIRDAIHAGLPVMAECGGFIYLHDAFEDDGGTMRPGAGIIQGTARRQSRLTRFGYVELSQESGDFMVDAGRIPAHEFHYYDSENNGDTFTARKPHGNRSWRCIHQTETMMAGFPHLYYYGNPAPAEAFLAKCRAYRKTKKGEPDDE